MAQSATFVDDTEVVERDVDAIELVHGPGVRRREPQSRRPRHHGAPRSLIDAAPVGAVRRRFSHRSACP